MNGSIGELAPSQTGLGYWEFTGKTIGEYELVLNEGDATHVIALTIEAGDPIRIQAALNRDALSEGDTALLNALEPTPTATRSPYPKTTRA